MLFKYLNNHLQRQIFFVSIGMAALNQAPIAADHILGRVAGLVLVIITVDQGVVLMIDIIIENTEDVILVTEEHIIVHVSKIIRTREEVVMSPEDTDHEDTTTEEEIVVTFRD